MGKCDEANVEVNMGDSASPMKPDNFTFTVPPEAPVFEPTPEEFQDPLAYISKIRPIAEKSGICKIKPPEHWQPPFAVDVDRLRFTPRIQRLNELEAITRVKLNFLDQIIKFWELQGSVLKIPTVEKKPLDLYALDKIVKEAGGFETCSAERKWSKIARRMGFPQGKGIGSILKGHYERILYPYDVFKSSGAVGDSKETKIEVQGDKTPEKINPTTRSRSATKASPVAAVTPPPPPRRFKLSEPEPAAEGSHTEGALAGADDEKKMKSPVKEDRGDAAETRRSPRENKWSGSGGEGSCGARVTRSTRLREHRLSNMTVSVTPAPSAPSSVAVGDCREEGDVADPLAKYMCRVCGRGDVEEQMLLCDGCDDSYHTFCLAPPLDQVPKGDWRCVVCIAEEVSKPAAAFGFEQARREYSLQQFGQMADQFKSDYFNMPVHMVPTSTVEKEFWRVVSSIDEDVTVEYGADLHSMDHGSGFPTKGSGEQFPGAAQYAACSWNLNNLPVLEGSVLRHIDVDISGMKVPWLYVGMCFATFCWHNEDHWSYSINYLHWGEPKTWYGVPGSKAEQFEAAMKAEAPELFQLQPDLLHQLVTIMNPNVLMKAGVPVYRTDQHAGEFVVTFPRAYHAGFNQGYNFAEAVNFTPADWLKMGRECIQHYSTLRRFCVFSHDELVCKMSLRAELLPLPVALAAYRDMRAMLHLERRLRKQLLDWGVTAATRSAFELVADDLRQCALCKTTCFLSCVACACGPRVACLRHHAALCDCPPARRTLRYRYTLDELPAMLDKLRIKSEAFRTWAEAVQNALDPDTPKVCDLDGLRAHLKKAQEMKMHKTELVRALETAIQDAEKCSSVIQQLDLNKMRTRTRQHDPKYRLTVEELTLFAEEIDTLACVLPEGSAVKEVLRQTEQFEKRATELLADELGETDPALIRDLEEAVELGSSLCIILEQLPPLQARLQQATFLEAVRRARQAALTPPALARLLAEGGAAPPSRRLQKEIAELARLKAEVEEWDQRARALLIDTSAPPAAALPPQQTSIRELATLLDEATTLGAEPAARAELTAALQHAADWLHKVEEIQSKDLYPYYHTLEALVKKGQSIPLALYEKEQLSSALQSAQRWKAGAADMFLKKNWPYTLMEALSPRTDLLSPRRRRPPAAPAAPAPSLEAAVFLKNFNEHSAPADIVAAFKFAEAAELAAVKELRARNLHKELRGAGGTFCACGKRQYGVMTQCELCKDWFHANCIAAMSEDREGSPPPADPPIAAEAKFLCGDCVRTKRPRLERILALLVWLQQLPVRLAEGEALQVVTERAMAWQDAARALLSDAELQANREKSDKLNAELKKANGRTHDAHMSQNARSASLEHAYSASPAPPAPAPAPAALLAQLEDLMLEGDLLEVTLDEQSHMWAAVVAARGGAGGGGGAGGAPAGAGGGKRGRRQCDAGRLKRRTRQERPAPANKRNRPAHGSNDRASVKAPSAPAKRGGATTTNYLNRKQSGSGSGLMMRRHYLARQQRRQRGKQVPNMHRGGRPRNSSNVPNGGNPSAQPRAGRGARAGGAGGAGAGAGAARRARSPRPSSPEDSSSNDDDEDCAAPDCLRPTGKEVDWVQCDGGCDQWFHMHCVGLARAALRDDDDYVCGACAARRPPRPAGQQPRAPSGQQLDSGATDGV